MSSQGRSSPPPPQAPPPPQQAPPHRQPAPPPLGALALATFRRGPFICLNGYCEVALGDAPVYDQDDYSSEDSDGPASAKGGPATTATKKQRKNKRKSGQEGEGGDELQQQQQQPKRRGAGKKAAAAAAASAAAGGEERNQEQEEQHEEETEEPERWVQCDRCLRWRVVPDEHWPAVEADPRPHWFCEWARWDVRGQVPFEAACPQR